MPLKVSGIRDSIVLVPECYERHALTVRTGFIFNPQPSIVDTYEGYNGKCLILFVW